MKGRFFANIFIHFEPLGHSLKKEGKKDNSNQKKQKSSEGVESQLPIYILPGSPSAQEWIAKRPEGYKVYYSYRSPICCSFILALRRFFHVCIFLFYLLLPS